MSILNVAVTSERGAVLEKLRDAGIPIIVWLTSILPFINDKPEKVEQIAGYLDSDNPKPRECSVNALGRIDCAQMPEVSAQTSEAVL